MADAMSAGKTEPLNQPAAAILLDEDGNEYTITPEAIKLGEDLTVAMARDVVLEVEEQKKRLLLRVAELMEEKKALLLEHQDVYYYLNKKLDDNFETISSLEEQILNEQGEREIQENILDREIENLKSQQMLEAQKYESRIQEQEMKLGQVTEFINQRDQYYKKMAELEAKLLEEQTTSKARIDELEMKFIIEHRSNGDRMEREIANIREEYMAKVDGSLDTKTQEILHENFRLKDEMKVRDKESHAVLGLNADIVDRDRGLRNEYELSKSAEKQLESKVGIYQHLIKQLNERNGELEQEVDQLKTTVADLEETSAQRDFEPEDGSSGDQARLEFLNIMANNYTTKIGSFKKINKVGKKELDSVICGAFQIISRKYPNRFSAILQQRGNLLKLPKLPPSPQKSPTRYVGSSGEAGADSHTKSNHSPQKWWSGGKSGFLSGDLVEAVGIETTKHTQKVEKFTQTEEASGISVLEVSSLKNVVILGERAKTPVPKQDLRKEELDAITSNNETSSLPTSISEDSDPTSAETSSHFLSVKSESYAKNTTKSRRGKGSKHHHTRPAPMLAGGTLVFDPEFRSTTPTFLSSSDSKSGLAVVSDNLMGMVVGRRIEASVNLPSVASLGQASPPTSTEGRSTQCRAPGSRAKSMQKVESSSSPVMHRSDSSITDTVDQEADHTNSKDEIWDSGQVSPSSSVSMSPRLEALDL